ncbi:recombinase RecA [Balneolales bacterium ANBcel1]|nr:recombinase RecA [Balneolales bacterium ANBcel1]
MADNERRKAIDLAVGQIEKQYGKGTIMRLGDQPIANIPCISTGSMVVDHALGVGGVPRGRITEIYGPESSGKTTLALHVIAEAQKAGGHAAIIDAEHAFDPKYGKALGIKIDELLISQPDNGEQALEIAETLIRSAALDVVVIDSVAALVPRAELDGEMGDSQVGLQARLMSQALRKLTGIVNRTHTSVIFINQLREKIGVMFGNPETTTGGKALKFYSSVRIDIRRIGAIKRGDEVTGNRTKVKVVKNKVAPPFKTCEFNIMYGKGISRIAELLDLAVQFDIVQKRGSWYRYDGDPIGQGTDSAIQFLQEDEQLANKIEGIVRNKLMPDHYPENGKEKAGSAAGSSSESPSSQTAAGKKAAGTPGGGAAGETTGSGRE